MSFPLPKCGKVSRLWPNPTARKEIWYNIIVECMCMNEEKTRQRERTLPMREAVLLRKHAMALAAESSIGEEHALDLFNSTGIG